MTKLSRILATELTPKRLPPKVKLKNKVTGVRGFDNLGKEYDVYLLFGDDKKATKEDPLLVLDIKWAGGWAERHLSSLLGKERWSQRIGDVFAFYGDYAVSGMDNVLKEAEKIAKNRSKS